MPPLGKASWCTSVNQAAARRDEALRWLAVADDDLAAVERCLEHGAPLPAIAAYHCQQALEKLAKAMLVLAGVGFRRTHDLQELALALEDPHPALAPAFRALAWVTIWSFAYRYPLEEEEPSLSADEVRAVAAEIGPLRRRVAEAIGSAASGPEGAG
jgi:HEPN domain-containing protein